MQGIQDIGVGVGFFFIFIPRVACMYMYVQYSTVQYK